MTSPRKDAAPALLALPAHLRARIYTALSSLSHHRHPHTVDLNKRTAPKDSHYCCCPLSFPNTHSLLLTCRLIYGEVSSAVYAQNHFFIRFNDSKSLDGLFNLRPTSIQALQRLTIHLNVAGCGQGRPCERDVSPWYRIDPKLMDAPFCIRDQVTQDALYQWQRAWQEHIHPFLGTTPRLQELNLICDVTDFETGNAFMQPLLASDQSLVAKCSIRLSPSRNEALKDLAERAVLAVTGRRLSDVEPTKTLAQESPFRFTDLPTELRLRILGYTSLVLREAEVEFNPTYGFCYRTSLMCEPKYPSGGRHGSEDRCLWEDRHPVNEFEFRCKEQSVSRGCFCTSYHAACSNFRSCDRWKSPTPLFLVSRFVRQDALQVFFSQNRFVVGPPGVCELCTPVRTAPGRLPISVFLKDVVPRCALRHLSYLEVVFPTFTEDLPYPYCPPGSAVHRDLIQTLSEIGAVEVLPRLTLSIYFVLWLGPTIVSGPPRRVCKATRDDVARSYADILAPFKQLRGMRRFFAALSDPTESGDSGYNEDVYGKDWERMVESMVMGDAYDAVAQGKIDLLGRLEDIPTAKKMSVWYLYNERWEDEYYM